MTNAYAPCVQSFIQGQTVPQMTRSSRRVLALPVMLMLRRLSLVGKRDAVPARSFQLNVRNRSEFHVGLPEYFIV